MKNTLWRKKKVDFTAASLICFGVLEYVLEMREDTFPVSEMPMFCEKHFSLTKL